MLQDVHVEVVQVTLVRRVLALVIVLLAAGPVSAGLSGLAHMVLVPFIDSSSLPSTFQFQLCVTFPLSIFILLGTFVVLSRWNRRMLAGNTPWFCRWSIPRMAQCIVALLVLRGLTPHILYWSPTSPDPISPLTMGLWHAQWSIIMVGYCVLWLWWADVLAGRLAQQLLVGAMWFFYSLLFSLYPVRLIVTLSTGQGLPSKFPPITNFHLGDVEVEARWIALFRWPDVLWSSVPSPLTQALCVFLCAVLLQLAYHPWRKKVETNSVSILP